jgi:CheY-like chemotaxis protein
VLAAFVKRLERPYVTVSDGAEAVRLYQAAAPEGSDPFDCIFMNISMPVMNGFQAVTVIRQFEERQQQDL